MNLSDAFRKAEIELNPRTTSCKGLFFRGYSSTYYDNDGKIERKEGLRLLKRKSCNAFEGCNSFDDDISKIRCDWWMLDEMRESLDYDCVIFPEIENKVLYSLRITNETYDFESGHCDGYDLEFYKVEKDG